MRVRTATRTCAKNDDVHCVFCSTGTNCTLGCVDGQRLGHVQRDRERERQRERETTIMRAPGPPRIVLRYDYNGTWHTLLLWSILLDFPQPDEI